jgi:hypothetical protein
VEEDSSGISRKNQHFAQAQTLPLRHRFRKERHHSYKDTAEKNLCMSFRPPVEAAGVQESDASDQASEKQQHFAQV